MRVTDPGLQPDRRCLGKPSEENINAELQKRIDAGEEGLKVSSTSRCRWASLRLLWPTTLPVRRSFQETTRVPTEAAIKGKVDPLSGLEGETSSSVS